MHSVCKPSAESGFGLLNPIIVPHRPAVPVALAFAEHGHPLQVVWRRFTQPHVRLRALAGATTRPQPAKSRLAFQAISVLLSLPVGNGKMASRSFFPSIIMLSQTISPARIVAIFAILFVTAGCAVPVAKNQARISISSFPEGAVISSGNISGTSPQLIRWTLPGPTGYALVTATWVSGAQRIVRLNLSGGTDGGYVIARPDVPGLQTDLQYAARLHRQNDAQNAELLKAFTDGLNGNGQKKSGVSCDSIRMGTMVHTECK